MLNHVLLQMHRDTGRDSDLGGGIQAWGGVSMYTVSANGGGEENMHFGGAIY